MRPYEGQWREPGIVSESVQVAPGRDERHHLWGLEGIIMAIILFVPGVAPGEGFYAARVFNVAVALRYVSVG